MPLDVPFTITNWFERTPASLVTKRRGIISSTVAFTKADFAWTGTSALIAQQNYTASDRFTLWRIPSKPIECYYFFTIGYRVGAKRVEYWIWDHPYTSIVANDTYYKYTNQIILPNFSIKAYTVDNTAERADAVELMKYLQLPVAANSATVDDTQELETSILTVPSDLRSYGSTEYAAGNDVGTPTLDSNLILPLDNTTGAWLDNTYDYNEAV